MKFPYTPVDTIISEVSASMSDWEQQDQFDHDNAYMYAIEASRLVGLHAYDNDVCVIPIKNHVGFLPKEFYLCEEIWNLEECQPSADNTLSFNNLYFVPKYLMHPGDVSTVKLCSNYKNPSIPENIVSYYFKRFQVRTSFKDGHIMLKYLHLPKDERGVICIQDEINCIMAVKNYILMNLLKPGFVMGNVAGYIYQDVKNDWYTYYNQATAMQVFPDPSKAEWEAAKNQNRYNSFNL